jgi:hypothetical protein
MEKMMGEIVETLEVATVVIAEKDSLEKAMPARMVAELLLSPPTALLGIFTLSMVGLRGLESHLRAMGTLMMANNTVVKRMSYLKNMRFPKSSREQRNTRM